MEVSHEATHSSLRDGDWTHPELNDKSSGGPPLPATCSSPGCSPTVSDAAVMIDTTTGQLGITFSSARYKRDIETMASRSEGCSSSGPVTFVYKDDAAAAPRYGL